MKIGSIDLGEMPVLLAPMEEITDGVFRRICREQGADMVVTEFISSEGLIRDASKSLKKLVFKPEERPLSIQIFGHDPEAMRQAAGLAQAAGPDSIDLNFGCPVRKVVEKGGGASLLRDIPRMLAITKAVVSATHLPVTAKTRLGWNENSKIIVDLAEQLQDCGIKALTIHGRTRVQMYSGQADWTLIGEVKNNSRMQIPIIGNGDVDSVFKAKEMFDRYSVDGIMVGRAAIGNPFIFRQIKEYLSCGTMPSEISIHERVETCRRHLKESAIDKGERRAVVEMRKHYSGYFKGVPEFKKTRIKLLTCSTLAAVDQLLMSITRGITAD